MYDHNGFSFVSPGNYGTLLLWISCFMPFSVCVFLLCRRLLELLLLICLSSFAAAKRNVSWSESSRSLMACSVSMASLVQLVVEGLCRLYCRPLFSRSISSLVNRMLVRLTVRG